MIDVKVKDFLCLNARIPLTCTLANEYPSSNEISKKNGTVRGVCIACDALFVEDIIRLSLTLDWFSPLIATAYRDR